MGRWPVLAVVTAMDLVRHPVTLGAPVCPEKPARLARRDRSPYLPPSTRIRQFRTRHLLNTLKDQWLTK